MEDILIKDVHEIKNTLQKFGIRLELMHNALVGNEILKDGGIVADLINQKAEIMALTKRVQAVESQEAKRQVYIRIIWGVVGAVVVFLFNYFFHK